MEPNADSAFFDSHSIPDQAVGTGPADMLGAIFYGGERHSRLRAASLDCIVGPNDPRYPRDADVLDLRLDDAALLKNLKEPPAHWWPLCGASRDDGKPVILHLNAADFSALARGLSRLARAFPALRLIVDPFLGGKASKWQAGVCLAEESNIWLTTRGLYAAEKSWPERSEREALHFTVGEVGAGKLLFASGMTPAQLNLQGTKPAEWLKSVPFLEPAQRELILRKNVDDAFAGLIDAVQPTHLRSGK